MSSWILITMLDGRERYENGAQIEELFEVVTHVDGELRVLNATQIRFQSGRILLVRTSLADVLAQLRLRAKEAA